MSYLDLATKILELLEERKWVLLDCSIEQYVDCADTPSIVEIATLLNDLWRIYYQSERRAEYEFIG